jgi:hypothetical protein
MRAADEMRRLREELAETRRAAQAERADRAAGRLERPPRG